MILKIFFGLQFRLLYSLFLFATCSFATIQEDALQNSIHNLEKTLKAQIGVSLYEVSSKKLWHYNGDKHFPLMSTFKTLACAKLLYDIDNGKESFKTFEIISKNSLITWSPISEKFIGKQFNLYQACEAAMTMSDNTAANIILAHTGGPSALTQFMRFIGDDITRLDRNEPELNEALKADLRDTTSPNAIVKSLDKLIFGDYLQETSKKQLIKWMQENKVSDNLLRSVLPKNWVIADRSGAGGNGSRGITAVIWASELASPLIISIYITQTKASFEERNKTIAKIGDMIFSIYQK